MKQKTEIILKDLQKNFRGGWFANIQNLAMVTLALHGCMGCPDGERSQGRKMAE